MTYHDKAIATYALMAWMTFGHAWVNSDERWTDMKVIQSIACAAAWPLYLSAQVWEEIG